MLCAVVLCTFICGLCRVSNGSSKCSGSTCRQHECCVLFCLVLYYSVLLCARQLMLPANATSLFCRYPLGTWHKLCCSYVYCPNLFYDMLNYFVLCVVASSLCHIQNGYLLRRVMYCSVLCCSALYCIVLFCLDLWASIKQQIICFVL